MVALVVQQRVDAARSVQPQARRARAQAAFLRVERDARVEPERDGLHEAGAVAGAHVGVDDGARAQLRDRLVHRKRHSQGARVVVAGAHGNDAQPRALSAREAHKPVAYLVDGPVAAHAHDGVVARAAGGKPACIARRVGEHDVNCRARPLLPA